MPVKNVKRKTNDGFEGVITGLNDKEKEIIANSIGGGSDEIIEANGTFMIVEEETGTIINTLSFDNDTAQKIKEGKIKVICGYLQNFEADNDPDYFYCTLNRIQDAQTNYPTCYYRQEGNDLDKEIFTYAISISFSDEEPSCTAMLAKLKNGNLTPSLPSDASSKNYTLEANNGTIAWTESGGATYTAGKNISISEANEISVADKVSNLTSIDFVANFSGDTNLTLKDYNGLGVRTKNSWCPSINFTNDVYSYYSVTLNWKNLTWGNNNYVYFDFKNKAGGDFYPFMSRVSVPDVPTADGTYVLKATVSSGTLTYSWVKEGE